MQYTIITDSCANLPDKMYDDLGIEVISMEFIEEGKIHTSYIKGRDNDLQKYYTMLREGKVLSTTCINAKRYEDFFEPYLASGQDILYLGFSSKLSASFDNSLQAVKNLKEKYPERKIYAVDTLSACMGQGLLAYYAALKKQEGKSIEEVRDWVENNKLRMCHWFTVDDLKYLYRGGRVNKMSFIVGKITHIKPVLHTDNEGRLTPVSKVIGRRKSISSIAEKTRELIFNPQDQHIFIAHGDCEEDAMELKKQALQGLKVKSVTINQIDPVIGCHSGPGTLAIFFFGKHR
jgi:DegV family protein with EDD domain